jgi:hypothetical protein
VPVLPLLPASTSLNLELMELENIVANTVYLKAREGGPEGSKGRSKKWKKLLTFPHISECIELADTLKADTYGYIVGEQPIGAALFRKFCEASNKSYYHYNDFLDAVENYETELEEHRVLEAIKIAAKYLTKTKIDDHDLKENDTLDNGKTEDKSKTETRLESGEEESFNHENQVDKDGLNEDRRDTNPDVDVIKYINILSDELVAETNNKLDSKARDLFRSCVLEVKSFLSEEPYREFRKIENMLSNTKRLKFNGDVLYCMAVLVFQDLGLGTPF